MLRISKFSKQIQPRKYEPIYAQKPKKHNKTNVLGFLNFNEPKRVQPEELPTFEVNSSLNYKNLVEPLLPKCFVPEMPAQAGSTWQPVNYEKLAELNQQGKLPYMIRRGVFHTLEESVTEEDIEVLPYNILQIWRYPSEPLFRVTKISNIEGDYEALVADVESCLKAYFKYHGDEEDFTSVQINELDNAIYVKGFWSDILLEYFYKKGF